jgi:ectoine hydroxylase-related dioxygenase (phytanoyl-CoA dioxygenase family)
MDDWFRAISTSCVLQGDAAEELRDSGFVVLHSVVAPAKIPELAAAYDAAMAVADSIDVGTGRSTTRVHDFVNRGPEFDDLYVYEPILAACCSVIGRGFKLSTMHARTLNPCSPPQGLHVDFPRGEEDRAMDMWPMVGFIFMVDEFRPENGATCFLPGSQGTAEAPGTLDDAVSACGPAGSMIIYNGSVWHEHGPNGTRSPRRSIQGAFIRRTERAALDWRFRMRPETLFRLNPLAKYLLDV